MNICMAIKFNWKDMKTHEEDTSLAIPLFLFFGEEDETFIQEDYVSSKKFFFHPEMHYSKLVDEEERWFDLRRGEVHYPSINRVGDIIVSTN